MHYTVDFEQYSGKRLEQLHDLLSPNLFQTSNWIALQNVLSDRSIGPLLVIRKDETIIGYSTVIIHTLPAHQTYAYVNRGPIIADEYVADSTLFQTLHATLHTWCREHSMLYYRMALPNSFLYDEPDESILGLEEVFENLHALPAPNQHQPEFTSIIDITKTEEDILKNMKPKGRYNIKVAEKHGIIVKQFNEKSPAAALETALEHYFQLAQTTTTRNKFSGHTKAFYASFLDSLDGKAVLYLAYYENKPVAGIILVYDGDTAIYYYGASDNAYRKYMAPYAIHLEAIRDAKNHNCSRYDLFGIAPPGDEKHSWRGITMFKEKFGGITYQYLKTYDFPVSGMKYWFFRTLHTLKKAISR